MAVNQIKAGVVLNYCLIILNTFVGILYTPYMLRMLGQSEYGIYSLATSIIAYLGIIDFGFGNAIVRYVARFRAEGDIEKQQNLFGMFSCIYIFLGLVTFILGIILGYNTNYFFDKTLSEYELSQMRIIIFLLAFNLGFTFMFNIYSSSITAYEDFIFQKVIQIIRIVLNTLVMIILLYYGYKAIGLVVCQTAFNVVTQILNWYYFRYKLKISIRFGHFDWLLFKEICSYSIWIFAVFMIDRIYWSTGSLILGAEVGTIAVSIFSVAMTLERMYQGFSLSISGLFLPRLTKMVANNSSNQELSNLFIKIGRIQFFISGLFLSTFIVLGRQFVRLWAGQDYIESYFCTILIIVGHIIPIISHIGSLILEASNDLKFRVLCLFVFTLLCVIVQFYLCKLYGAIGCCVAISLTLTCGQGIVLMIYYWKRHQIDIPSFLREISKMLVVPIVMIGLGMVLFSYFPIKETWGVLLFSMCCFCALYLVLSYMITLNICERRLLLRSFNIIKNLVFFKKKV